MRKSDVLSHFGNVEATAKALGITKSAVYQWGDVVPKGAAYIAQAVSNGALAVDPATYPPKKFKPVPQDSAA